MSARGDKLAGGPAFDLNPAFTPPQGTGKNVGLTMSARGDKLAGGPAFDLNPAFTPPQGTGKT